MLLSKLDTLRRDKKPDMTPMIDVTFLLLIFFMCTLRFRTLEGKLSALLPSDVGVAPTSAEPVEKIAVKLEVVREGTRIAPHHDGPWRGHGPFAYDVDRALSYHVGPRAYSTIEGVQQRLEELHAGAPERGVVIDAAPRTVYGDVVPVLDACTLIGFENVAFAAAQGR